MVSDSNSVVFMRINSVFNIISVAWYPGINSPDNVCSSKEKEFCGIKTNFSSKNIEKRMDLTLLT